MRRQRMRTFLAVLGLLGVAACGGSSGGGTVVVQDFPAFVTTVFQTPVAGTDPDPLTAVPTLNQFTDDETAFSHLVN